MSAEQSWWFNLWSFANVGTGRNEGVQKSSSLVLNEIYFELTQQVSPFMTILNAWGWMMRSN